ncbi:MAG: hypothetical protein LBG44_00570 [Gemmatimonadota bacterium]|nr:hypothetical protein [Gemmatimonadota bacterium]
MSENRLRMPGAGDEARLVLRSLLGENSPILPFAEGVFLHLLGSGALDSGGDADELIDIIRGVHEGREVPPARLAGNPRLFASFFQNLDLTPPSGHEARAVVRLVNGAMEMVEGGEG